MVSSEPAKRGLLGETSSWKKWLLHVQYIIGHLFTYNPQQKSSSASFTLRLPSEYVIWAFTLCAINNVINGSTMLRNFFIIIVFYLFDIVILLFFVIVVPLSMVILSPFIIIFLPSNVTLPNGLVVVTDDPALIRNPSNV